MIIVDTGVLLAAVNVDDEYHAACRDALGQSHGPLVVPAPILTETCYMVATRIGAESEAVLLESAAVGQFQLGQTTSADLRRMAELVRKYRDFPLGATRVATIDHRHFRAVRPNHCEAFELFPALLPRK